MRYTSALTWAAALEFVVDLPTLDLQMSFLQRSFGTLTLNIP